MIIAIQRGLEGIKEKLLERGYQVVYYDEYKHPIDAYVYVGYYDNNTGFQNTLAPVNSVSNISHGDNWGNGVMMINALNKNISEIDYMLKTRCYSTVSSLNYVF